MNLYKTSSPRAALSIAAAAMTAITLGFAVIVPANMDPASRDPAATAAPQPAATASTNLDAAPFRVEVFGVRTPELITVQARNVQTKRKQQS